MKKGNIREILIALVIFVIVMVLLCTIKLRAAEFENYKYNVLDDGTIEITKYTGTETEVIIPTVIDEKIVTSIKSNAFYYCKSITSIKIPVNVTNIGECAFYGCENLISINVSEDNQEYISENGVLFNKEKTEIIRYPEGKQENTFIIPSGVTKVGNYAFYNCKRLTSVEISEDVISIGNYAFYFCTGLTNIEIPGNVISIGENAFDACSNLISIEISEGVKSFGTSAFRRCSSLISIKIPNTVTELDEFGIFENCTSLTSIIIPESMKKIGYETFKGCSSLTDIKIPSSVTEVYYNAFNGCSSLKKIEVDENNKSFMDDNGVLYTKDKTILKRYPEGKKETEYSIWNTVKSIGMDAFSGCKNLTNIKIPNSVNVIHKSAFYGCSSLTNIDIPNSVTTIGLDTFYNCSSLISVKIPSSVTYLGHEYSSNTESVLGEDIFSGCTSLQKIEVDENNENYMDDNGVLYTKNKERLIKYPGGKQEKTYFILRETKCIGYRAFNDNKYLTSICIPENVRVILQEAFDCCSNLEKVIIPSNVEAISWRAFNSDSDKLIIICEIGTRAQTYAASNNISYLIDEETPIIEEVTGYSTQWTKENVILKIYAEDDLSGLAEKPYSFDEGKTWQKENIKIYSEYVEKVQIQVRDFFGNTYINKDIEIKIDKEAPDIIKVTGNPIEWTKENVILKIYAEDDLSGLAEKPYSFDGGKTWQKENTKAYVENTNGIIIKVRDVLGNTYTHEQINITKIDKEAPVIKEITGNPTEWTEENVTLTIKAEDKMSGLGEEPYSFDGGKTWQKENAKTYEKNITGIVIKVKDSVGNITDYGETINITKIRKAIGLEITKTPTKTEYKAHENFDKAGIRVKVTYDNGDMEETSDYTVINGTNLTCLVKKIELKYNKNNSIKAELPINVEHIEVIEQEVEPTCTTEGKTEGKHCSVCNKIIVVQEIIPAKGHTEVVDGGIEPTCTTEGKTEGKHCLVCNTIIVQQQNVPALGHNYVNEECTRCGKKKPKIKVTSEKYEIGEEYVRGVAPKTKVEHLIGNLETNAEEIKIYTKDKEQLEKNKLVGTGMQLELKLDNEMMTLTLVVAGDVNGDGDAKLSDMTKINRYRLHKITLEEENVFAGDVTGDGKVDLKDLVKINRYRLHKIAEL